MNGCIAPRQTTRCLILGVTLILGSVLAAYSESALARELERETPPRGEQHKRIEGASSVDVPRGIVVAQSAASDPAVARLEVRLSELERDLRASTGRVEELSYQVRQLSDRLEKLSSDVDYRLGQQGAGATGSTVAAAPNQPAPPSSREPASPGYRAGSEDGPTILGRLPESEARTATAPPAAPEPAAPAESSTQTAAAVSTGTPREQYAHGFGLLRKANYDEAEIAFSEFLKNNPDDPLADNARYWLGETYYARGQYAPAAEAFLDAYQMNKAGPKAPDALLKLGMSLGSLNKVPEACATYQELRTALPDAPVSIKNKAEQERRNLGCK